MVAVEAPDAGFAVAYGTPVQRSVGLAVAEIPVFAAEITLLTGEGDDIGRVHALARNLLVSALLVGLAHLRELADAAGVGVGGDAVVGDAESYPYCTLSTLSLADDLHNPGLILVAHRERFAGGAVAVFLNQIVHHHDGFAGCCRTLQGDVHQGEIIEPALFVAEFLAAVPGGLHDGYLFLVHQTYHRIGVLCLRNIVGFGVGAPATQGNHFVLGVAARRGITQSPGKAEAVAVIGAYHAPVGGSLLSYYQVGAGI